MPAKRLDGQLRVRYEYEDDEENDGEDAKAAKKHQAGEDSVSNAT
jgi:hypothetical protein